MCSKMFIMASLKIESNVNVDKKKRFSYVNSGPKQIISNFMKTCIKIEKHQQY